MADNDGGTNGAAAGQQVGGTPVSAEEQAARFECAPTYCPTGAGRGYWNVVVRDTYTGVKNSGYAYEAGQIDTVAKQIAGDLVASQSADLNEAKSYRFNLPNAEEQIEGDALDNPSENALEAGGN